MDKVKAKIRVATDMYEFIELDVEGTQEEIWDEYQLLKAKTRLQAGLKDKDFNDAIDRYLTEGTGVLEIYNAMSPQQKDVMQTIKRSLKRIKARQEKV